MNCIPCSVVDASASESCVACCTAGHDACNKVVASKSQLPCYLREQFNLNWERPSQILMSQPRLHRMNINRHASVTNYQGSYEIMSLFYGGFDVSDAIRQQLTEVLFHMYMPDYKSDSFLRPDEYKWNIEPINCKDVDRVYLTKSDDRLKKIYVKVGPRDMELHRPTSPPARRHGTTRLRVMYTNAYDESGKSTPDYIAKLQAEDMPIPFYTRTKQFKDLWKCDVPNNQSIGTKLKTKINNLFRHVSRYSNPQFRRETNDVYLSVFGLLMAMQCRLYSMIAKQNTHEGLELTEAYVRNNDNWKRDALSDPEGVHKKRWRNLKSTGKFKGHFEIMFHMLNTLRKLHKRFRDEQSRFSSSNPLGNRWDDFQSDMKMLFDRAEIIYAEIKKICEHNETHGFRDRMGGMRVYGHFVFEAAELQEKFEARDNCLTLIGGRRDYFENLFNFLDPFNLQHALGGSRQLLKLRTDLGKFKFTGTWGNDSTVDQQLREAVTGWRESDDLARKKDIAKRLLWRIYLVLGTGQTETFWNMYRLFYEQYLFRPCLTMRSQENEFVYQRCSRRESENDEFVYTRPVSV